MCACVRVCARVHERVCVCVYVCVCVCARARGIDKTGEMLCRVTQTMPSGVRPHVNAYGHRAWQRIKKQTQKQREKQLQKQVNKSRAYAKQEVVQAQVKTCTEADEKLTQ